MADAVTNRTVINTPKEIVVHLTNISDGTGEAAVVKVDKSTLTDINGVEPGGLSIERVSYAIQNMKSVRLLWDHTTDDVGVVLASGNGFIDIKGRPGWLRDVSSTPGLADPASAGGTGDILLTTDGATTGGTYDVTLWLRKVPA